MHTNANTTPTIPPPLPSASYNTALLSFKNFKSYLAHAAPPLLEPSKILSVPANHKLSLNAKHKLCLNPTTTLPLTASMTPLPSPTSKLTIISPSKFQQHTHILPSLQIQDDIKPKKIKFEINPKSNMFVNESSFQVLELKSPFLLPKIIETTST